MSRMRQHRGHAREALCPTELRGDAPLFRQRCPMSPSMSHGCSCHPSASTRQAPTPRASVVPSRRDCALRVIVRASGRNRGGGEGGIRTPDTVARMPHFECGAIDHSATSPSGRRTARPSGRGDYLANEGRTHKRAQGDATVPAHASLASRHGRQGGRTGKADAYSAQPIAGNATQGWPGPPRSRKQPARSFSRLLVAGTSP